MLYINNLKFSNNQYFTYALQDNGIYNIVGKEKEILKLFAKLSNHAYSSNISNIVYIPYSNIKVKDILKLYDLNCYDDKNANLDYIKLSFKQQLELNLAIANNLKTNVILISSFNTNVDFHLLNEYKNEYLIIVANSNQALLANNILLNNYTKVNLNINDLKKVETIKKPFNKDVFKLVYKYTKNNNIFSFINLLIGSIILVLILLCIYLTNITKQELIINYIKNGNTAATITNDAYLDDDVDKLDQIVNIDLRCSYFFEDKSANQSFLNTSIYFKNNLNKYATSYVVNDELDDFEIMVNDYALYFWREIGLINFVKLEECKNMQIELTIYDSSFLDNVVTSDKYRFKILDIIYTPFNNIYINHLDFNYEKYQDYFIIIGNKKTYYYLDIRPNSTTNFALFADLYDTNSDTSKLKFTNIDPNLKINEIIISNDYLSYLGIDNVGETTTVNFIHNLSKIERSYEVKIKDISTENDYFAISVDLVKDFSYYTYLNFYYDGDPTYITNEVVASHTNLFYEGYINGWCNLTNDFIMEEEINLAFNQININYKISLIALIICAFIFILTNTLDGYLFVKKNYNLFMFLETNKNLKSNTLMHLMKKLPFILLSIIVGFSLFILMKYFISIKLHGSYSFIFNSMEILIPVISLLCILIINVLINKLVWGCYNC